MQQTHPEYDYCDECGGPCRLQYRCSFGLPEVNVVVAEPNTGVKFDEGKLRIDLIPPEAITALAKVLAYGPTKGYADYGWESVEVMRLWAAAQRHLWAWKEGQHMDSESGLPHLWHALANIAFMVALEARGAK